MAARNSGMPEEGVYFVKPSASACAAASLICCGVSKSGSPAPKPQTSTPSALSFFALASMASVSEGVRVVARSASCCMDDPSDSNCTMRMYEYEGSEFAVVEVLDQRLEVVLADADDFHFPLRVLGRIAGVSGVDHDVLAELAADRA